MSILEKIIKTSKKQLAQLIDPDKFDYKTVEKQINAANKANVNYIFLGGSLISNDGMEKSIKLIKELTQIPIIIFPGNSTHFNPNADAILFLSLISGRNPDFLIGNHVNTAPIIKKSGIESIPTGYMLIESGKFTTVQYISNTFPIPRDKADVAVATAIAGEMLGLKTIYLDAGSGAKESVHELMVEQVKKNINIPLIVGGGIRDAETAVKLAKHGADIIVIGNAAEENPEFIIEVSKKLNTI